MLKFRGNIFGINRYLSNIIFNLHVPISNPDVDVGKLDTKEELENHLQEIHKS